MKLSEVKSNDCITVWVGYNMIAQSDAKNIFDEEYLNLNLKGKKLTYMEDELIEKDISIQEWNKLNNN
jgi:hypothetical protein